MCVCVRAVIHNNKNREMEKGEKMQGFKIESTRVEKHFAICIIYI